MGKTTSAVHLAHGLGLAGKKVVLMDLDPQGNASLAVQSMSIEGQSGAQQTGAFADLIPLRDQLWVLPSPGAEGNLGPDSKPDVQALQELRDGLEAEGVDWLLVDCPPRMDAWGLAGVAICQELILPVQAEFFAMHGLSQMMETLEEIRSHQSPDGGLLGVLVTMLQTDEAVALEVVENLRQNLGDRLFRARIYRDSQFVEAASHGLSLFDYNLEAKGARSYGELVREVLYGRPQTG